MKTKRLSFVLFAAALILAVALVVFSACGNGHQHTFSKEWSHDDESHWHDATCAHNVQGDKAPHDFDADGYCPTCGYLAGTKGLVFEPDESGDGWAVSCQGNPGATVEIPSYYQDKPVTTVKAEAFYGFSGIKNLTIPHTVKEIGEEAFENCGIETVTFGESIELESVGSYAFNGDPVTKVYYGGTLASWCKIQFGDGGEDHNGDADANPMAPYFGDDERERHFYLVNNGVAEELTEIVIPQEVTKLLDYTFYGFTEVTSVTVHNGVTEIGNTFGSLNKLETLTIPFVGRRNGELDGNFWAMFQETSSMAPLDIVVTNATTLPNQAFYNVPVKNLTLPATLTRLGWGVVSGCKNLSNVYFNGTLEDWCNIEFDGDTSNPMSGRQFYYLDNGQQTGIPSNFVIPDSVEHVSSFAFVGVSGLTSVTIPASVTSIGANAFYNCKEIESLTLNGSPTVEQVAFYGCPKISTVTLASAENIQMHDYLENNGIAVSLETVVILGGTSIGVSAFMGCVNLKNVTLPSGIQQIGDWAFTGCYALEEIDLPSGLEQIGENAFEGCYNLAEIDLPSSLTQIGAAAFSSCFSLKKITFPENLSSIGNYAFADCDSLAEVTIPQTIQQLGEWVFDGCDILTIYVEIEHPEDESELGWGSRWEGSSKVVWDCNNNDVATDGYIYKYIDGIKYALSGEEATVVHNHYTDEVVIPSVVQYNGQNYTVTTIRYYAFSEGSSSEPAIQEFYDRFNLTSIVIPATVTTIENGAFIGCDQLETVTFESGSQLEVLENGAFGIDEEHNSLQDVYFGGTLENWCNVKFSYGSSPMIAAEHFYLPSGEGWEELTEIVIPESVTEVPSYAFGGFDNVTSITVHENVTKIGTDTFEKCKAETVYWNAKDCDMGNTLTAKFASVTTAVIGENVEKLPEILFYNCKKLQTVTFSGDKLTTIGRRTFGGCTALTEITIPSSVYTIKAYAFDGCTGLQRVTFDNPDGWQVDGYDVTLTDPAANAVLLTQTYLTVDWDRY